MHEALKDVLVHVKERWPDFFSGKSVLELGSYNINGSVREFFDTPDHVGVDWRPGPCVDVTSLAHEYDGGRLFDVVISCNMLEHDPHGLKSIANGVRHLANDGMLFLSWGGNMCHKHHVDISPDRRFHALPAGHVLELLMRQDMGVHIQYFQYERAFTLKRRRFDTVFILAFTQSWRLRFPQVVERLFDRDAPNLDCPELTARNPKHGHTRSAVGDEL